MGISKVFQTLIIELLRGKSPDIESVLNEDKLIEMRGNKEKDSKKNRGLRKFKITKVPKTISESTSEIPYAQEIQENDTNEIVDEKEIIEKEKEEFPEKKAPSRFGIRVLEFQQSENRKRLESSYFKQRRTINDILFVLFCILFGISTFVMWRKM